MSHRFAIVNLALGNLVGVDGAIRGMATAARSTGVPIDVVALWPGEAKNDGDVRFVPYPAWSRMQRLQKLFRYRAITNARLDRYDVVFLRYPMSLDLDPLALFRHPIARRIVTIHHSHELREMWSGARNAGMAARVALEWANGRRILSRVDGIVGVTDEIRAHEVERSGVSKPSAVVSNGIDVESVPFTRFRPFDGTNLHLALVASHIAPWHGWDRLRRALATYRGSVQIVVHAVGGFDRECGVVDRESNAEVRYHGLLRGEALSEILSGVTLAVSSLALHRVGLRQGCVLKTREYAARGLPFVYAYDDVDLREADTFCLRLPSGDDPIDLHALIDFASRVSQTSDNADLARAAANARMSWTTKMQLFEDFGNELLA